MESCAEDKPADRRWHPVENPEEWENTTRQSIFESIQRCVTHAVYGSLSNATQPHELHASDTVFQELHICAEAYARGLYALGHNPDSAAAVIVAAARQACAPIELHASVVSALQQWCREA
jgi:hypothetical protein